VTDADSFIERMGLASESDGLSRIAGRLFGVLLLGDEPRSLDALADQLGVSKASVSTEARRLVERGVAERVGKPGDRRDYYALAPDFFAKIIRFRVSRWASLHRLVREMQTSGADQPRVVRERFAYIDDVHAFILARVEEALAEWIEQRNVTTVRDRSRGSRQRSAAKAGSRRQLNRERVG
jgi:DNA-binding MarR family transcriptional regulator